MEEITIKQQDEEQFGICEEIEIYTMFYRCPNCNDPISSAFEIAEGYNYCPYCSIKINWIK
ncbi:MAG: hypothetical protein M0R17_08155 [Candidatus Omnitrophica bacterium]|jgi:DNA-directed RNA polymerase subunit RPC12/RpoP|nr:hypothetical protein [Candidatus Omnitrophota bacterium]